MDRSGFGAPFGSEVRAASELKHFTQSHCQIWDVIGLIQTSIKIKEGVSEAPPTRLHTTFWVLLPSLTSDPFYITRWKCDEFFFTHWTFALKNKLEVKNRNDLSSSLFSCVYSDRVFAFYWVIIKVALGQNQWWVRRRIYLPQFAKNLDDFCFFQTWIIS